MIRFDRAMLGTDIGTLDKRQQIALHTFTAHIATTGICAGANLVDLVQKYDAILLNSFKGSACDGFVVQKFVGLFANQNFVAF